MSMGIDWIVVPLPLCTSGTLSHTTTVSLTVTISFLAGRLGFFLDELFAVGRLVGGDDFFREFVGHVVVV